MGAVCFKGAPHKEEEKFDKHFELNSCSPVEGGTVGSGSHPPGHPLASKGASNKSSHGAPDNQPIPSTFVSADAKVTSSYDSSVSDNVEHTLEATPTAGGYSFMQSQGLQNDRLGDGTEAPKVVPGLSNPTPMVGSHDDVLAPGIFGPKKFASLPGYSSQATSPDVPSKADDRTFIEPSSNDLHMSSPQPVPGISPRASCSPPSSPRTYTPPTFSPSPAQQNTPMYPSVSSSFRPDNPDPQSNHPSDSQSPTFSHAEEDVAQPAPSLHPFHRDFASNAGAPNLSPGAPESDPVSITWGENPSAQAPLHDPVVSDSYCIAGSTSLVGGSVTVAGDDGVSRHVDTLTSLPNISVPVSSDGVTAASLHSTRDTAALESPFMELEGVTHSMNPSQMSSQQQSSFMADETPPPISVPRRGSSKATTVSPVRPEVTSVKKVKRNGEHKDRQRSVSSAAAKSRAPVSAQRSRSSSRHGRGQLAPAGGGGSSFMRRNGSDSSFMQKAGGGSSFAGGLESEMSTMSSRMGGVNPSRRKASTPQPQSMGGTNVGLQHAASLPARLANQPSPQRSPQQVATADAYASLEHAAVSMSSVMSADGPPRMHSAPGMEHMRPGHMTGHQMSPTGGTAWPVQTQNAHMAPMMSPNPGLAPRMSPAMAQGMHPTMGPVGMHHGAFPGVSANAMQQALMRRKGQLGSGKDPLSPELAALLGKDSRNMQRKVMEKTGKGGHRRSQSSMVPSGGQQMMANAHGGFPMAQVPNGMHPGMVYPNMMPVQQQQLAMQQQMAHAAAAAARQNGAHATAQMHMQQQMKMSTGRQVPNRSPHSGQSAATKPHGLSKASSEASSVSGGGAEGKTKKHKNEARSSSGKHSARSKLSGPNVSGADAVARVNVAGAPRRS